ncbi:MAG: hypothetical protein A2X46_19185 [Lentisphaerae bacterium GWF2_57_35]|nr:MAG: hypothetical protein A2X46_19185 [Lentisphaerae bacterium GWF2_57_35]
MDSRMKRYLGVAAALLVGFAVAAQAKSWEDDFEKASAEAKQSGKYMLVDFSGSDWCGWCIKLDKEVFSRKEFKVFAEDNLVLVLLDFPRQKPQSKKLAKQNDALQKKYGIKGFPTVLILDPSGQLVETTGYQAGGAEPYVEMLKKIIEEHKASTAKAGGE